ncbi:hypothetical protein [Runella slithyformis]|uniref:Uncharacterized protein n=1 Tax=Runella slithyformis (strain ATCC 29530 / DSM 19594 / LMG 11500 / NCIMB 11436 / LSU 4) TaxID=761193 RepID=A0A7U3ZN32_RUNSL|nr:hypothetical protein [Runella slithyformis]AEI50257.1 hypothetical protein Runsl_3901 [Runella slithyformis DSM 19594]
MKLNKELFTKAKNDFFNLSNYPFFYRWNIEVEENKVVVKVKTPEMRFYVRNEEINLVISHFVHSGFSIKLLSVEKISYQLIDNK